MKALYTVITAAIFALSSFCAAAQNQQEPLNFVDMAAKQADKFAELYNLDMVQVFRVDSLFQVVYPALSAEFEQMKKGGAMNTDSYTSVNDKWWNIIYTNLEQIFTPEQWAKYMKSSAGKEKKKRDKRMAAANK